MAGSSEDVGNDNRQPVRRSPANSSASGLGASAAPEKAGSLNKKIRKMIAVTLAFGVAAAVVWSFRASSGSVSRNDRSQVVQIPANDSNQVGAYRDGSVDMTYQIENFDPETGIVKGSLAFPAWQTSDLHKRLYLNGVQITRTSPLNSLGSITDSLVPITSVPYQVAVTGTAAAFPSDSYRVRFSVSLSYRGLHGPEYLSNHSLSVRVGPRTNSYVVEAPDPRRDMNSADTEFLTLLITRKTPDIVWYYAIAVVPAVLILALIWQLVSGGGSRITLEAGIGILAILSLRQVIVPANIHTMTRIDLLLGIEAAVMILLVTWGVVTWGALQKSS
jgi:hypothetical protein